MSLINHGHDFDGCVHDDSGDHNHGLDLLKAEHLRPPCSTSTCSSGARSSPPPPPAAFSNLVVPQVVVEFFFSSPPRSSLPRSPCSPRRSPSDARLGIFFTSQGPPPTKRSLDTTGQRPQPQPHHHQPRQRQQSLQLARTQTFRTSSCSLPQYLPHSSWE